MVAMRIRDFIRLTRPLFLFGGFLLYALGTITAAVEGIEIQLSRLVIGQVLVTLIQLMTHYSNEYYDLQADALNLNRTPFSGGSGVLINGSISPAAALLAAHVTALGAILILIFVAPQSPVVFFAGAASLLASWSYSAPPLALSRSGLGEITASLIVALMVPFIGYTFQSGGTISLSLLLICLPLILIHFAMLIAFQIPDRFADQAVGKRTLAVRLGLRRTVLAHNGALLLACLVVLGLVLNQVPGTRLAWLAVPLAVWQIITFRQERILNSPRYLSLTMGAIALFGFSAALWVAGYLLDWING